MTVELTVGLLWEPLEAPRTGLWCDRCLLPSRCEREIVLYGRGVPLHRHTVSWCDSCGRQTERHHDPPEREP